MNKELSHIDQHGKASMVDVSNKENQLRKARAYGRISISPETSALIENSLIKKGDVLTIAEIAGIQATKQCSQLIPLCHPLQLTKVDVETKLHKLYVEVWGSARCIGKTGIEMEALTAVSVCLLTVYDMCKAVDKNMKIGDIKLLEKTKEDL